MPFHILIQSILMLVHWFSIWKNKAMSLGVERKLENVLKKETLDLFWQTIYIFISIFKIAFMDISPQYWMYPVTAY